MASCSWLTRALAFAAVPAVVAASGGADTSVQCQGVLKSIAKYGDFEAKALCRSQFPPQVCSETNSLLGARPWAADRIEDACNRWVSAWPSDDTARVLKAAEKASTMEDAMGNKSASELPEKTPKTPTKIELPEMTLPSTLEATTTTKTTTTVTAATTAASLPSAKTEATTTQEPAATTVTTGPTNATATDATPKAVAAATATSSKPQAAITLEPHTSATTAMPTVLKSEAATTLEPASATTAAKPTSATTAIPTTLKPRTTKASLALAQKYEETSDAVPPAAATRVQLSTATIAGLAAAALVGSGVALVRRRRSHCSGAILECIPAEEVEAPLVVEDDGSCIE